MKKHRVFGVLGFMGGFLITRIDYVHSILDKYDALDVVIGVFFAIIAIYLIANIKKVED